MEVCIEPCYKLNFLVISNVFLLRQYLGFWQPLASGLPVLMQN